MKVVTQDHMVLNNIVNACFLLEVASTGIPNVFMHIHLHFLNKMCRQLSQSNGGRANFPPEPYTEVGIYLFYIPIIQAVFLTQLLISTHFDKNEHSAKPLFIDSIHLIKNDKK